MTPSPITIIPVLPVWLILLLSALGLAAVLYQFPLLRKRLSSRQAWALSFLRLSAGFLLISLALNPTYTERREHPGIQDLAILLDTSPSMGLPGQGGKGNRLEEAREILFSGAKPLFPSLAEKFRVRVYTFGESLEEVKVESSWPGAAQERKGNLTAALETLARQNCPVILLSDGNFRWAEDPELSLPLLVIPVGDPGSHRDILIQEVKAPPMAFRGREVAVDVAVKSYGYPDLTIPVLLKEGDKLIQAKNIRLPGGTAEGTVSFPLTLEELGHHSFNVSVPLQAQESIPTNNSLPFSLQVVRDKIRVLLISGTPSLNFRFMRLALKNDPTIDLLSFVILRTPTDIMNVPLNEQSLIPFPVDTLFSSELRNFDLLIFENFLYSLYLRPAHLERVREFVKEGGGLAMIGGPNFVEGRGYGGSPIDEILPTQFAGKESYRRDSLSGVRLTRAGRVHPVMRFGPEEKENSDLWQEMPSLNGLNLLETKGMGRVLLESTGGGLRPVLISGTYGRGRVLVLATDESWKWYMGTVARGEGNWAYLRFMERLVRWLTQDPGLEAVQIHFAERMGIRGQRQELKIRWREADSPLSGMTVSVLSPEGFKIASPIQPSGPAGEYRVSFLPEKEGVYKVQIETHEGGWEKSILVAPFMDSRDGAPDPERLKRIAHKTGGVGLSRGEELLKEIEARAGGKERRFLEERRSPLWAHFTVLAFILALFSTEWYLRRKWGLA